jgi:hypothetical protein
MGLSRDTTTRQLAGHPDGPRLRTAAAAQYLALAQNTLEKMRVYGGGPEFERSGPKVVVYSIRALEEFLASRRATSTSDRPPSPSPAPKRKPARKTAAPAAPARKGRRPA